MTPKAPQPRKAPRPEFELAPVAPRQSGGFPLWACDRDSRDAATLLHDVADSVAAARFFREN